MAKYPQQVQEVGRLVDLGVFALTQVAIPVSATSRIVMAVSIQATSTNTGDVLVGDGTNQSMQLAARDVITVQVGDANNVWLRTPLGETGNANVWLLVPPGVR
jgi:hypothetical protein